MYTRTFPATLKGSMTLEAAVVYPVFACFVVAILFFFRVLQCSMCVEKAMDYAARTTASITVDADESPTATLAKCIALFEVKLAEEDVPSQFVAGGIPGITFPGSDMAGDDIVFATAYIVKLPISMFGLKAVPVTQQVVSRKWIGYTGATASQEDGEYVYVTEYGTVYHETTACTHLDLTIMTTSAGGISEYRNHGGANYYACELCKPKKGGTVYYTEYGTAYHDDLACSGLKRTIYRKKKSEVSLPPCSKCGGL